MPKGCARDSDAFFRKAWCMDTVLRLQRQGFAAFRTWVAGLGIGAVWLAVRVLVKAYEHDKPNANHYETHWVACRNGGPFSGQHPRCPRRDYT